MTSKQEVECLMGFAQQCLADPDQTPRRQQVALSACDVPGDPPRTLLKFAMDGTQADVGRHVLSIARRRFPHAPISG